MKLWVPEFMTFISTWKLTYQSMGKNILMIFRIYNSLHFKQFSLRPFLLLITIFIQYELIIPPGFRATAAFFSAAKPVKRATVPGRANEDVENIIGITPELFTCDRNNEPYKYSSNWLKI